MQSMNITQYPVANSIIALLKQGILPWYPCPELRPWPRSFATGQVYKGLDCLILASQNQASPYWLTVEAVHLLGGRIINGFEPVFISTPDGENHAAAQGVLNLGQCEGITTKRPARAPDPCPDPVEAAHDLVASVPFAPVIGHEDTSACYCPPTDTILLPEPGSFDTPGHYALLLLHLLAHSTGHPERLGRDTDWFACFDLEPFGTEELVASIGACLLCSRLGICLEPSVTAKEQAAGWFKALSVDPRMLIRAADLGQQAARYIVTCSRKQAALASQVNEGGRPVLQSARRYRVSDASVQRLDA